MPKEITVSFPYAGDLTNFPLSFYLQPMTEANYLGIQDVTFDAAGQVVVDVDAYAVNAGDKVICIGTNYNGIPAPTDRQIAGEATVVDTTPTPSGTFAPLSVNYSSASFTSVIVPAAEPIKASIIGMTGTTNKFILGSVGNASLYVRVSDGRVRLEDATGASYQFSGGVETAALTDGLAHDIEVKNNGADIELWIDGALALTLANKNKPDIAFTEIGISTLGGVTITNGAVYNIELGTIAAWTMLGADDEFNGADSIGSNNLTYNDAPALIDNSHTIDTGA